MFVWQERPLDSDRKKHNSDSRYAMYRRELEDRAALLYRLKYSAKQAKARLAANVGWDFELHGKPKHAAEVERIVDAVYKRGGMGAGTPQV